MEYGIGGISPYCFPGNKFPGYWLPCPGQPPIAWGFNPMWRFQPHESYIASYFHTPPNKKKAPDLSGA